ncbi:MAG: DNA recombination protein RmuC [Spirochaetaceae bacterium]|nr:DNA recombination protein RmuC [Spirochaetaceae bacterium]
MPLADPLMQEGGPAFDALAPLLGSPLGPEATLFGLAGLVVGGLLGLLVGALLSGLVFGRLSSRLSTRLRDTFQSLSADALDRSNERFLALAGERLGALTRQGDDALARREAAVEALVRPLRESLARVDEKLQQVETERAGHYHSLTKHLELVATSHRELERQTRSLSEALKTPNVRGRWGELQLRRVVELAGMLDHCDFREQTTIVVEGRRARPDLVVDLPGGRQVVVDAKAPLEAYLAASEAGDERERTRLLDEHAKHVRRHLDDLAGRGYGAMLGASPEFVVLFLPGEPFFSAALARDPELIERGVDRGVLIAGPTTLIALLRAIAYGWQQEEMAANAAAVSALGRELFDRILTLNERFGRLGQRLDGAVEAYNAALGCFESRVQVSARRMAELGIAPSKPLPEIEPLERRARPPRDADLDPDASDPATA